MTRPPATTRNQRIAERLDCLRSGRAAPLLPADHENVNKPFAIILDGKGAFGPNINEPILGGSARISGSFHPAGRCQPCHRAAFGALPVDLKVVEERSVGPDLGAD